MRLRPLPDDPELGWIPYAWLIYLAFVLVPLAMGRASALEWGLTLAGVAVFLVLYFTAYWLNDRKILWCIAGILLLGMVSAPANPGASAYFIYAASFIGYAGRPRFAFWGLLALVGVAVVESWLLHLPVYFWGPAILFSLLVGGVNIHQAEVSRTNAKLRRAQEEVELLAKTAERERIARDLHDLLGHTLSLITLKAELAGKLLDRDPERAGREIREVERISREALREVRTAVAGYRSQGLPAELARARLALEAAGVGLEYFAVPLELEPAEETVLALALREAVTNIIRHAGASTCRIALEQTAAETRLEVCDDGRGGAAPEGIGLASMRERVEGLGGRLERRAGTGTSLLIILPRRSGPSAAAEAREIRAELPAEGLA
ncbi:MAG: two-component system, NarL family, sensor histidine kinase DesK [Acidobacteriota bacterium]|jgi:two-component system sensor histidine kinase DesK|nr:two-component system, NarL family, sensor histidine kinase DesK [Acidobacteriota bacterium]